MKHLAGMRKRTGRGASLLLLAGAAAAGPAVARAEAETLFAYDRAAPFAIEERARESHDGVLVRDLGFAGGSPGRLVSALLVSPAGPDGAATTPPRSRPGVLWVHWLGEPATSNRTQFRDEAIALTRATGTTSLLVEAMWSDPKWYGARVPEEDFAISVRQVIELRRALDLLAAQPGVDATRLAMVGHDYGAMYGAMAAAADGRVRTCVWIAATPSLLDWAFFARQPASRADYERQLQPLDIRSHLGRIREAHTLLQFGGRDRYVPREKAEEFAAAVAGPKEFRFYDEAGHAMTAPPEIRGERTAWLQRELAQ